MRKRYLLPKTFSVKTPANFLHKSVLPRVEVLCPMALHVSSAMARISSTSYVNPLFRDGHYSIDQKVITCLYKDGHIHLLPIHRCCGRICRGDQQRSTSRSGVSSWVWYYHCMGCSRETTRNQCVIIRILMASP